MSCAAHLNVKEAADGLLDVMEVYEGGFDAGNAAHRFLRALGKKASELSVEMVGDPLLIESATAIEVDAHPLLTPGCGPIHPPS